MVKERKKDGGIGTEEEATMDGPEGAIPGVFHTLQCLLHCSARKFAISCFYSCNFELGVSAVSVEEVTLLRLLLPARKIEKRCKKHQRTIEKQQMITGRHR